MNWLQRLFGLDRAQAEERDPDVAVHIATLPLWQTPLIVAGLEQRGITATFAELPTHQRVTPIGLVYVRERDRDDAETIIAELTAQ